MLYKAGLFWIVSVLCCDRLDSNAFDSDVINCVVLDWLVLECVVQYCVVLDWIVLWELFCFVLSWTGLY